MGRTKGAKNKQIVPPEVVGIRDDAKLVILADILLEIIFEENKDAATNS